MKDPILNAPILSTPVEEHLRASVPPGETDRMWRSFKLREQSVPARRASRRRRIAAWVSAGTLSLAAAAALLLWLLPAQSAGPLALTGGHALPDTLGAHEGPAVFDLDDGSRIVLAPATEAQVIANTPSQVRTRLARGSATFDVRPGGPRRWIIDAAEARVEVLGTRFTVTRRGDVVEVHVERGLVEVHHPGRASTRLTAGQSITVGEVVASSSELSDPPDQETNTQPATVANEVPESASLTPTAPPTSEFPGTEIESAWRVRALRGDFAGAFRLLGPRGLRSSAATADPEELLLLADVARRSGHSTDAMPLYRRLMERSPGDVRAPVAAFSLGRLQLEREPGAAAESFAFVRTHRAGTALAEDATALEVRAASQAGRGERAARVARLYLEHFPNGRRAESMRRLLGR